MPVRITQFTLSARDIAHFWQRVAVKDGCWEWAGAMNPVGYGLMSRLDKPLAVRAHRVSFLIANGYLPETDIDHLCRNRACVNPAHLEAVTHRENVLRGTAPMAVQAAKTHCKNGHRFVPETTYTPPSRPRSRICMLCPNYLAKGARRDASRARKQAARRAAKAA